MSPQPHTFARLSCLAQVVLATLAGCSLVPKGEGIDPPASARATQVVAGRLHTCALTDKGRVRCWGQNDDGQVGTGDPRYYETPESDLIDLHDLINTPMEIEGLEGVTAIATSPVSAHNCALVTGGEVRCWGADGVGQLGTGMAYTDSRPRESPVPVAVAGLSGIQAIAVGAVHACALTASGGVMCWGLSSNGQLGDGSEIPAPDDFDPPYANQPVAVQGLTGALAIASGPYHTCAITSGRGLVCWGDNGVGQSGGDALVEGYPMNLNVPTPVLGLSSGVAEIFLGAYTTCAKMTSGEMRCFGSELGIGSEEQLKKPASLAVSPVTHAELSPLAVVRPDLFTSSVSCAVVGGAARCWGYNEDGGLGNRMGVDADDYDQVIPGYTTWFPVDVHGLGSGVRDMSLGGGQVCALLENGALKCWGDRVTGNGDESGTRLASGLPQNVVSLP